PANRESRCDSLGIFLVDAHTPDVSSTDIRKRLAEGLQIHGLLVGGVVRQIACMTKTEKRRAPKRLTGDVGRVVRAALEKKASDVVLLDLRNTPAFTDFFVLCSGQNTRQVKAIADAVEETLRAAKVR